MSGNTVPPLLTTRKDSGKLIDPRLTENPPFLRKSDVNCSSLMGSTETAAEPICIDHLPSFQPSRDAQHELIYNRFLPYTEVLPDEAARWLADIKENLAKCVLSADFRPGVFFWTTRLESYITLYGRMFSKVDHVNFIKLYLDLMLDPGMEPNLVVRFCKMNNELLRKLELLCPEDLTVDWKPLYELYDKVENSKDQYHGIFYWPEKTEDILRELIGYCRYYFPLSATQEMLDEWRPMFCPFDESMAKAMNYASIFLPTMLKPEQGKHGFQLWLEEFLRIWLGFHGVPAWEAPMLQLFSRVAAENIGHIKWEKYVSSIFTKFLRTLELPVGKKQLQLVYSHESFDESSAVLWPVAMIHIESVMVALERLFKSVESYFHPSNYGNWTDKLSSTLMYLPMGMVARLQLERFRPKDWMPEIPQEACLTDAMIKRFVTAFKPLAFLNLFSKAADEAVNAIQNLALLAPDEMFPDLLEKFYASVDTLTEPQRFQAVVSALQASLPYIFLYKDGKKNVVPLMLAMLPGIDSNDARKTATTLAFFSTLCIMLPLRPCYDKADSDTISDADREICTQTADFEDILMQLLDRCLTLIDNFTVEPGARSDAAKMANTSDMNGEEKVIKGRMDLLWLTVFTQCDNNIAKLIMDKLYVTASSHIYPIQQMGAVAVSSMCMLAMRLRPELAKQAILHRVLRLLEIRLEERPNIAELTNLDDELLWALKLAGDVVSVSGRHVIEYVDRVKSVLRLTIMVKCQSGHKLACVLGRSLLTTLLRTYPINHYATEEEIYGPGCNDGSPIALWGKKVQPHQVKVNWHAPDAEIVALSSVFFEEFTAEPLESLERYASGNVNFEDKHIQKLLHVIEALFSGVSTHCGFDFDEPANLPDVDMVYPKDELPLTMAVPLEITLQGKPIRRTLANLLHRIVDRILVGQQDETKALKTVLVIYKAIMMSRGCNPEEAYMIAQSLEIIKKELDNRLEPKKSRFRVLFIEKARVQHEIRGVFQRASRMTKMRLDVLRVIVKLAVSRYKEVRSTAQSYYGDIVGMLQLSYRYVLDDILKYLAESKDRVDDNDAQLKGCLHLLLGAKNMSYVLKHDWDTLRKVFPAIVQAQHSENPTVSKVLDAVCEKCETMFVTTGLTVVPSEPANKVAASILGTMNLELEVIFDHTLKFGMKKLEEKNAKNVRLYRELVDDLVTMLTAPQIRLKNFTIGHIFLSYFVRNDIAPPLSVVQFTLERLLDSTDKTRRSSVLMMISIMRTIKPKRKRIRIQPCHSTLGTDLPLPTTIGIREDNLWLCFDQSRVPTTEEQYDSAIFIDKIYPGYYGWPKGGLEVTAPVNQQDIVDRTPSQMSDVERVIYEKFINEHYVDSLLKYLSSEDFTHAEFDSENFLMLRAIFRHFRNSVVPLFYAHLSKLVSSREEHQQRAAAEILTGLIRGSKRWPYRQISKLWQDIIPIIQTALNNITGETESDWISFATNSIGYGDMRQMFPLLHSVMTVSPADTGFQTTSKLAVIHGIFECSDWRRRDLHYQVLDLIETRLTDSYRDHVAFLLSVVFRHDVNLPNINTTVDQGPKASDFFQKYYPKCLTLLVADGSHTTLGMLNLFKTIVKAIVTHVSSLAALRPDILRFYPLLCRFENDPRDGDLAKDCISALTCFSQVFLSENSIPCLLQEVRSVVIDSTNMPWRARVVALDNLQICVFNNLLTIMERADWVAEITSLILDRLLDEQIEVRQMASVTLTGFIQCNFIPMTEAFVKRFRQLALSVLPRDKTSVQYGENLIKRHAGVLGLSACVAAHPYEVTALIPGMLMELGEHINDPPPISATVRATFSEFRRTHHDTWREHKEKFSDDQLALLTDLLVSQNYYA